MKEFPRLFIPAACLAFVAMALPGGASGQTAPRAKASVAAPRYDAAKEVAVEGTVADVVTKPTPGMLAGAHALLTTPSGTLDAHLGNYALKGTTALALAAGQHVRMVGVMENVHGRPVLLVRTVQIGAGLYTVRNTHGFLLRSGSASATRPEKGAKGER